MSHCVLTFDLLSSQFTVHRTPEHKNDSLGLFYSLDTSITVAIERAILDSCFQGNAVCSSVVQAKGWRREFHEIHPMYAWIPFHFFPNRRFKPQKSITD